MSGKAMHMAEVVSNEFKTEKKNKMGSTVLDTFTKLTNETESVRLDGGLTLLRHLYQQTFDQSDNKEFKYAMTRIIRSLGSSKPCSRKGFYTTLTVFLTMHPETSIEQILSVMETELHPVNSNNKSENADIYMGRILAYGALIRSKILIKNNTDTQVKIMEDLIKSGKQRSYLSFISALFLVEFLNQIDVENIKQAIWPVVEKECGKSWLEQTLDTFYILLVMKQKCPSLVNKKFIKKHLDAEDIITKESMGNVVKLLTDLPRIISCQHPVFELFCKKLVTTDLVPDFWACMDQRFMKPSKSDEYLAVQLLKLILANITDKSIITSLLSPNFVQHILKRFSNCKRHDSDEILVAFKEILNLIVSATNDNDISLKTKMGVLKKLILYPGDLMIEKKTGTRVVQIISGNFNLDGVKKLSKIYRDIIENTTPKEKQNAKSELFWTNSERVYAAQLLTKLLGHSATVTDQEWRLEQLKFLFNYGLCEVSNVGVELAPSFKETFYRALDHKLSKLNDLRCVLSKLVHFVNLNLKSKSLKLRNPLSEEAEEAWEKVTQLIDKMESNPKKAEALPVFHTMNLHMGLQLFSDPEMAIMSINELDSCYERLGKKSKKNKLKNSKKEDEPEWVEVVVDLLLSLLSRNSHLLRSLVGCVFPHICPYVTPTAIHQILAVLDVKNEKGPLVTKGDLDDEDSDVDLNSNDESGNENEEEKSEGSSEESDSDSDGEEEEEEEEDETVTDRVRLAVRQALGDASIQTDDEDMDIDQIDEDEGKRLNESLAAAFKILKENRRSRSKKQEKSAQVLTHFRGRVIDLLETYLESSPSMAIALDMVIPLFVLLEYCIRDPHQKPLQCRVRSCLKKLSLVKKFKDTKGVNSEILIVILKALIEKGERTASVCHEMGDKLAECCTFLVRCAQQADVPMEPIVEIYGENLTAFFKKRDCVLPAMLFKTILQLHWEGNWQLAPLLVDFAFDSTVRSFRRGLALEFLTIFYKNGRLVHSDTEHVRTRMKIEKKLYKNTVNMLQELSNAHNNENDKINSNCSSEIGKEVRQRFVCLLLTLLHSVHSQHLPQAWDWKELGNVLTVYRSQVSLANDAKRAYNKLATQIGISVNVSTKKNKDEEIRRINGQSTKPLTEETNVEENGNTDSEDDVSTLTKSELKKRKKNKSKQKDKQLLKKEARMLREKAMSDGLETFKFSSVVLPNKMDETETLQNGDSQEEELCSSPSQKRELKSTPDVESKQKKRKKSLSIA